MGAVSSSRLYSFSTSLAAGSPSTPIEPVSVHRTVLSVAKFHLYRLSIALFPSVLLSDTSPRSKLGSSAASFTTAAPGPVSGPLTVNWAALSVAVHALLSLAFTVPSSILRLIAESNSGVCSSSTRLAAGSPTIPVAPIAVYGTVSQELP